MSFFEELKADAKQTGLKILLIIVLVLVAFTLTKCI